jgi:hypothetical protein
MRGGGGIAPSPRLLFTIFAFIVDVLHHLIGDVFNLQL